MADVEAIRARLRALSPEQRSELDNLLGQHDTRAASAASIRGDDGKTLSYPHMQPFRAEYLDPETTEGQINNAMIAAMPMGKMVGGVLGAAKQGLGPAVGALGSVAKKAAIGGLAGAGVGSLPVVGMGAKEGAQLGAMIGAGQGGSGALWKHGKRKELIKSVMGWMGAGADDAAPAVAKAGAQASDEVVQALMGADPNLTEDAARHLATAIAGKAAPVAKKSTDFARDVSGARPRQAATKAIPKTAKPAADDLEGQLRASLKPKGTVTGGTAGSGSPDEIAEKVQNWRSAQGFSDQQILESLRNVYGIPERAGRQLLKMLE